MTRLDRHVNAVRTKLAVGTFLSALAWSLLVFGLVVWLNILIDRFLAWRLPKWQIWLFAGLGVSVAAALAYSFWRRPTRQQAAVAIDQALGLKEKFSTALYVRPLKDPFAAAAVRDAEVTADNVSLHKRFPVRIPRTLAGAAVVAVLAVLTGWLLGPHPLFASDQAAKQLAKAQQEQALSDTRKILDQAIARIDSTPKTEANKETIEAARREIMAHMDNPRPNLQVARQSAMDAMQKMEAIKEKLKEQQKYANAKNELRELTKNLGPSIDEKSPVGKVQKEIADGKFQAAVNDLGEVVKKFDQMNKEDQQKAAQQMAEMSKQLQKMAQDPAKQQQLQQQLQQMGANQQQVQQLQNLVQQAAGGDKQAQQQVQQMANQISQAINNNPNLTPQQQQAIAQQVQGLVNQMQGAANNQQTAQQMANAAKQLAQAMQQKAGQQAGQNQPGGQQSQPGQQQPGNGQTAGRQGQKPGQGQGQGQGQKGQQGQNLADAGQQMQQTLEQLQQAADDANDIAQQQDMAGGNAQGNGAGNEDGGQGQLQQPNNNIGPWQAGDPKGFGAGSGGPGISAGGPRPKGTEAPFGVKREQAPSQTIQSGKIIASHFIKASAEKGVSRVAASEIAEAAEKEATDEVEQERISKPAQKVVKQYFDDLKKGE